MIKEPWEIEIAHHIKQGSKPDVARPFTMIRWAYHGDLRPLAAAIKEGHVPDEVLCFLAEMIDAGRLQMKPRRRGRPQMPEAFARNLGAAFAYEAKSSDESSDEAFKRIAAMLAKSPESVRHAVTRKRKTKNK
jgi:hypothetical protein